MAASLYQYSIILDSVVARQRDLDKAVLMMAFARFDVVALVVAAGTVLAVIFFLATAILLIKGPSSDAAHVGSHLGLFSTYLPGYSVSWFGSFIGAIYAWLVGALIGFFIALFWNLTHYIYIVLAVARAHWWRMMAD